MMQMSRTKKITLGLLLVCAVLLIVWDFYVAGNATDGDTISELTLHYAQRHPVLPWVLGVIMGHLMWPQYIARKDAPPEGVVD